MKLTPSIAIAGRRPIQLLPVLAPAALALALSPEAVAIVGQAIRTPFYGD
jgi:hypothetical protein